MALPVAVYEVRTTATANNVNGGGFNSARGGTDYSQQDAAQLTQADGSAVGTTTFTSVLGGFTSAMVGNFLKITTSGGGITTGWYEIVSYTNTNNVVLDRIPGTGTGSTFNVGGAISLASVQDDDFFEIQVPGSTIYIKSGTYSMGEAVVTANAGTSTLPISIVGYDSTRGDTPAGTGRPTLSFGANNFSMGDFYNLFNIIVTTTTANGLDVGQDSIIRNCKITNSSGTANRNGISSDTGARIMGCEVISTAGEGISAGTLGEALITGCYIHDCGTVGIETTTGDNIIITFNIIDTCVTGIAFGSTSNRNIIQQNTLYNGTTGISIATTTGFGHTIVGNIISTFTTGVNSNTNVKSNWYNYNNFYNCTTDRTNVDAGPNDFDTDPAFTDAANGNFTVGTAMKATSNPGIFPGALTTGYLDVGAAQRQEPAGGGGGFTSTVF